MRRVIQAFTMFVAVASAAEVRAEGPGGAGEVRGPEDVNQVQQVNQEMQQRFGFVPSFMRAVPSDALPGAWATVRDLILARTNIPEKYKALIAIGVGAQIPCDYCLYIDKHHAMAAGATEQEIKEAIEMAAITRQWSTILNGNQVDRQKFKAEVSQIDSYLKRERQNVAGNAPVTDMNSAYADIRRTLGMVPSMFKLFPPQSLAAAWNEFKSTELNPQTALSSRAKELIGLAVASQIPCDYCVTFHTQMARSAGAGDAEIREAIALAGVTRHWATLFSGQQLSPSTFRQEVDRMFPTPAGGAQGQMGTPGTMGTRGGMQGNQPEPRLQLQKPRIQNPMQQNPTQQNQMQQPSPSQSPRQ